VARQEAPITEGFDTTDLREARVLLDELEAPEVGSGM
jgi:hypothetical protein